jgi:hypothetical protein
LSDRKEGEKTATENEKEEDYNGKKIASPPEEPIVEGIRKAAVEKESGENDIEKSQSE